MEQLKTVNQHHQISNIFSSEVDMKRYKNKDTEYIAPLISPTTTNKNMIMYQIKSFKHFIIEINIRWYEYRTLCDKYIICT